MEMESVILDGLRNQHKQKRHLKDGKELLMYLHNMFLVTGRADVMFCNSFLQESLQLLINAIFLYEDGFFDCAFYSVRQAGEVLNTMLYLANCNNEELKKWNNKERFPMDGKVREQLHKLDSGYREISDLLKSYFDYHRKLIKRKVLAVYIIVLLGMIILDAINISDIISVPFNNINLDLWNIVIIVILYILTYEIVDRRENKRKKNQEEIAKEILEVTYKECNDYIKLIDNKLFKEVCPKRFPGDQTMENNAAYHNMKEAPFEHDSIIYSLGQEGIISALEIKNYINVKSKYHLYFSNVVCFPDVDEITNPLKVDLESEINKAVFDLKK